VHGKPLEFRELCREVLTGKTRYLVLDLDRTFHFGRNMGELFGWELGAFKNYGPDYYKLKSYREKTGRFIMDWRHPIRTLRYLFNGAKEWAYPGLFYLFFLKLAWRNRATRRYIFLRFGQQAVKHVQKVPLVALMHQSAGIPLETLKGVVEKLWKRYADDQVILPEDITWLRENYPGMKIIVSSSSPQPSVEVVRELFGVDDIVFTEVEEFSGRLSAPPFINKLYMQRRPSRISPPSMFKHNASYGKLHMLLERYPDMADLDVESVGITDTNYGEDHAWMNLFTRLADINSTDPFSPIRPVASPLREVHSAIVLTSGEIRIRKAGEPGYLDPRRKVKGDLLGRVFDRAELEQMLEPIMRRVEMLRQTYAKKMESLKPRMKDFGRFKSEISTSIEKAVHTYNESIGRVRRQSMAKIRRHLRFEYRLNRRLIRIKRPLIKMQVEILNLMEKSRKLIDRKLASNRGAD
jgi:hypothetical protein